MITKFIPKIFRARSARYLEDLQRYIPKIRDSEEYWLTRGEEKMRSQMAEWRRELEGAPEKDVAHRLRAIRLNVLGLVCAAATQLCGRANADDSMDNWDMRPYDVQLLGGLTLQDRQVAEIATGEGKTLVATLPACLFALAGRGVHIVTANDYLATRDAEWMATLYNHIGLSVGAIFNGQGGAERRDAYQRNITYGTASEFGFDYLRDHSVARSVEQKVQRKPFYALVDEADSVLIDEARVPLIITSPSQRSQAAEYQRLNGQVVRLVKQQQRLCNQLTTEARQLIESSDGDVTREVGEKLYKVQLSQPLHRTLIKLKESPPVARALEKVVLYYHGDDKRQELFDLKETLYFSVDERQNAVDLSDMGRAFLAPNDPDAFTIPEADPENDDAESEARLLKIAGRVHAVSQLLRAHSLYQRDVDYVVEEGEVVIIDRERDRPMPGRRWSDGLHQAVEAKESVRIQEETDTIASVTVQNYFSLYPHLAGMSGTASTSAEEFRDIYRLEVTSIPTNRPCVRIDDEDRILKTRREKYQAVIEEIKLANAEGQPVLVGTGSVEDSELVSRLLKRQRIPHKLLNAKNHAREAEIIAGAGAIGAVTISTNMAGRGTDIRLHEGVEELGGLLVIGTERHGSRRVDRQLRGRCARQGDPGRSAFFLSMEDELLRRFGNSERLVKIMEMAGHNKGQPLQHRWLSKAIGTAQKRVEAAHFESRKHVFRYDGIVARQRQAIYAWRDQILEVSHPVDEIWEAIESELDDESSRGGLLALYGGLLDEDGTMRSLRAEYSERCRQIGDHGELQDCERHVLIDKLDRAWREHLDALDVLREQSGFHRYAQKDPLLEFRRSAAIAYQDRQQNLLSDISKSLFLGIERWHAGEAQRRVEESARTALAQQMAKSEEPRNPQIAASAKLSRNAPCPCGSGMKFKRCCMNKAS